MICEKCEALNALIDGYRRERDEAREAYADARASRWHIIKERNAFMDEVDRLSESAKAAWHSECFMRNERDEALAERDSLRKQVTMLNMNCTTHYEHGRQLRRDLDETIDQRDEARAEVERLRVEAAPMNEHFNAGYRDGARDAYRRGAEAMREAAMGAAWHSSAMALHKKIKDLPIPEET